MKNVIKLNHIEYDLQNIFIIGNTACGKTTIARSFVNQLKNDNNEIYVIGDKAYIDYYDLNINICEDNYINRINKWKNELDNRMNNGFIGNKVIIIDDISSLLTRPFNNAESINNLHYLIDKGKHYGMYFIILSQRICESTYNDEFRKNTSLHIYMRCNNSDESKFLIGDDSLVSLKRGEFKVELI